MHSWSQTYTFSRPKRLPFLATRPKHIFSWHKRILFVGPNVYHFHGRNVYFFPKWYFVCPKPNPPVGPLFLFLLKTHFKNCLLYRHKIILNQIIIKRPETRIVLSRMEFCPIKREVFFSKRHCNIESKIKMNMLTGYNN